MPAKAYHHGDLKNALIKAGIEILSTEEIEALSLRRVAGKAGVSHSAPYAHFKDKLELLASISTEGFRQLYEALEQAHNAHFDQPDNLLKEVAYAYVQFALESPACFKLMFSGILEQEKAFPELLDISRRNVALLSATVTRCQETGLLREGPQDMLALSIWSLVHGFTMLLLEQQISHELLDQYSLRDLLRQTLNQVTARNLA